MSQPTEVELKASKEVKKPTEKEDKKKVKNDSSSASSSDTESSSDKSEKNEKKDTKKSSSEPNKESKEKTKDTKKESEEKPVEIKIMPKQWKTNEVCDWLKTINLGDDYTAQITKAKIDGEVLVTMTTQDFTQVGFAFGDARKAEMRVRSLRGGNNSPLDSPSSGRSRANTRISFSTMADYQSGYEVETSNLKTGWLEYKGINLHLWKKKYFILEGTEFRYYSLDTDVSPQGVISLVNAAIFTKIERENGVCKELFAVRTPTRDWLIRCYNEKDKAEWVSSLRAAIVKKNSAIPPRSKSSKFLRGNSFFGVK